MPPRTLAVFLGLLTLCSPGFGWWETGHRVVARAAVPLLTDAARVRLARILQVANTPEALANALADASIWPDQTKAQTRTGTWHFIDLTLQDSKSDIALRCGEDGNCVTARIVFFANELKSHPSEAQWSELDELRYVVHFVGDVHQPMHEVSDADQGGNCEQISPPIEEAKNLHALWDGGIVRAMDTSEEALTRTVTDRIAGMHHRQREKLSRGSADDWAWEGHELAVREVYHKLHIPVEPPVFPHSCSEAPVEIREFKPQIDMLYVDSMKPIIESQLIKASLRLARLLNESL